MNIKQYFILLLVVSVLIGSVYVINAIVIGQGRLEQGQYFVSAPANLTEILATSQVTLGASAPTIGNNVTNLTWYFVQGTTTTHIANRTNVTGLNFTGLMPITALPGYGNLTFNATSDPYAFLNHTVPSGNATFILNQSDSQNRSAGFNLIFIKNLGSNNLTIGNPANVSNVSGTVNFQIRYTGGFSYLITNSSWFLEGNGTNTTIGTSNTVGVVNISVDTTKLTDGSYIAHLNATNESGVPGVAGIGGMGFTLNNTVNITIDNSVPTITFTLSDNDGTVLTREKQTVTCSASDEVSRISGKVKIELEKPNGVVITGESGNVDATSKQFEHTFQDDDTAQSGTYKVRCKATDFSGNAGQLEKTFDVRVRSGGAPSGGVPGAPSFDYSLETRDIATASGREGSSKTFTIDGSTSHTIEFVKVTENSVTLRISSTPQEFTLSVGGSQDVDLNDDGKLDVKVTLTNIQNARASLDLEKLAGAAMIGEAPTPGEEPGAPEPGRAPGAGVAPERAGSATAIIIIIVIIIVIVGGYLLWSKGKKGKGKKGHVKFTRAELKPR